MVIRRQLACMILAGRFSKRMYLNRIRPDNYAFQILLDEIGLALERWRATAASFVR